MSTFGDEKMSQTDEERKAKKKEYESRPEVKAKRKKYYSRPENKAKRKELAKRPERKAKKKEYQKKYNTIYYSTHESKVWRKEYQKKDDDQRLKILQGYSKRLSNSDIPCCNCCGLNEYLDFLALDHITGKKQMDSIPELVKLGYSSKLENNKLKDWIIKNNFPKGFQILCWNCNISKGYSKNNKCPLKNKPH